MRRTLPALLTSLAALVMIVAFLVPHPFVRVPAMALQRTAVLLVACGMLMGGVNLLRVHLIGIAERRPDWPYRLVLVLGLLFTVLVGVFMDGAHFQDRGTLSLWLFESVYTPMQATLFALLAFFLASAAMRVLRVRTLESVLFTLAAVLVMLGRVPLGDACCRWLLDHEPLPQAIRAFRISAVEAWIMDVPQAAARRALLIGAAIGVLSMTLRSLLGHEPAPMSEEA